MIVRLSPHFTLDELTHTQVRGVDNTPDERQVDLLRRLAGKVLEPLRLRFGPILITSGYRSPAVNKIIGGSWASAHMCEGDRAAADSIPLARNVRWKDVIAFALDPDHGLPIDQIIYEYGRWLHIGTDAAEKCRRQALMTFKAGHYEKWNPDDPRVAR